MNKKLIIILSIFMSSAIFAQVRINYKQIYKEAAPGVVLLFGTNSKVGSTGTGSIVKEDGTILTNAHVVINPATHQPYKHLFAYTKPERINGKNANDLKFSHKIKVLSYDEEMDLAVVKMINPPKDLIVIPIADTKDIGIGESTAAIGHPEQGSRWSLTTGSISAEIDDFNGTKGKHVFQMETAVNRGNSGGPLLDYRGYLVGVNSMIARESKDGLAIVGINFAIKADAAITWMAEHGTYVSIVKNDGKLATPVVENRVAIKENTNTKAKLETKTQVKAKEKTVELAANDNKVKPNKNKLNLKVHKNNNGKTAKIGHKVVFRIVVSPKKKYRVRPKNVRVKSKLKSGETFTERDVLKFRAGKAHKKLHDKLGSWESDEVPGWDDDDTF